MEGVAVEDEGGDGFDSGGFGFGDAGFLFPEVNDLDVEAGGIEGGGDVLFGFDADRATGMVEGSFAGHDGFSFVVVLSPTMGDTVQRKREGAMGVVGTFW